VYITGDQSAGGLFTVKRFVLAGSAAVVGLVILLPAGFALLRPVTVLPRIDLAPGYDLVDQSGSRFTSEDGRGTVTLYSFAYTGCPLPCDGVFDVMRSVQAALDTVDTGGLKVRLVTIGLDHRHDSPGALTQLAARAGAKPDLWTFASSDSVRLLRAVRNGFGVFYEQMPDSTYRFSPAYVLVDGVGIVRGDYRIGVPRADDLVDGIARIAREARAEGVAHVMYEAAHFFACYSE
jgi:protein SCO1/2